MKKLYLTYNGKTQTVSEWSAETGISESVILSRHERKWSDEQVLTVPVRSRKRRKYEWKGKMYSVAQLAEIHGGISAYSMWQRLEKMSVKEAMETPRSKKGRKRETPKEEKEKEKPVVIVRRKVDLQQCRTCQYRGALGNSIGSGVFCAYSLITGNCRMFISEPSPHCTVYVKGKSLLRSTTMKQMGRGKW